MKRVSYSLTLSLFNETKLKTAQGNLIIVLHENFGLVATAALGYCHPMISPN